MWIGCSNQISIRSYPHLNLNGNLLNLYPHPYGANHNWIPGIEIRRRCMPTSFLPREIMHNICTRRIGLVSFKFKRIKIKTTFVWIWTFQIWMGNQLTTSPLSTWGARPLDLIQKEHASLLNENIWRKRERAMACCRPSFSCHPRAPIWLSNGCRSFKIWIKFKLD